ncbi:MAG: LamG domain-containing protein [Kiritimatiellaeota bacterium]|nr:LamG domain-containing protein [Kiritimatiellota bacterium]
MSSSSIRAIWFALSFSLATGAAPGSVVRLRPVVYCSFDSVRDPGRNDVGRLPSVKLRGGASIPGRKGRALEFSGAAGLEIADASPLRLDRDGVTLDLLVRFASPLRGANLVTKDREYLLRLDPGSENSQLSFFVFVDGSWEPRVRSIPLKPGRWYHVTAIWDGRTATLIVDGRVFRRVRKGSGNGTSNPVLVGGPSPWAPQGLRGALDEFRIFGRALSPAEVVCAQYALDLTPARRGGKSAVFDFSGGDGGWQVLPSHTAFKADGGSIATDAAAGSTLLLSPPLRAPVSDTYVVRLRMAVSGGDRGRLFFATTRGVRLIPFKLRPDDNFHTYTIRTGAWPEWSGNLVRLGILPGDATGRVRLDRVEVAAASPRHCHHPIRAAVRHCPRPPAGDDHRRSPQQWGAFTGPPRPPRGAARGAGRGTTRSTGGQPGAR